MSLAKRLAGLESLPIATWVSLIDPQRCVWANQAAVALWNAGSLEELIARDFSSNSEATAAQARRWLEGFRSRSIDVIETDWTMYPNGVPKRVRIFNSGIALDDGEYALLQQAIIKDTPIDPEVLRGTEAIRHTSVAIATLSATGQVLSRNPAMASGFGLERSPSQWFEQPKAHLEILAVARHGRVHHAQLSSRASGELRHHTLEARKTLDPVTGADAILVHLLDETARLGAERDARRKGQLVEELRGALATVEDQKQRWRALVDSAPDLVMIIDREHRIEFANRGFVGDPRGPDELLGQPVEDLFDPALRERMAAAIARVFETRQVQSVEMSSGGAQQPRQHSIRLGPIHTDGPIERLTLISSDVSEHRGLERDLRHSQKMQAVGTLAAGIAHDFNNLLMIIISSCELAALNATLGHSVEPQLEEVMSASDRASGLVRQLLAFGRKQVLEPKRVDLNLLVRELTTLLQRIIGPDITTVLRLDERPCWITADPSQIEQVVMNLVVNAADAMADGGTLTITTRWSTVSKDLILEVTDTGVGMDGELLARVFDPFFTTKEVGKGTGLGLAIAHGIVEQSGGRITVRSEPGAGSRFEVFLPRG